MLVEGILEVAAIDADGEAAHLLHVTKTGTGLQTFSGANSYSGVTTIQSGATLLDANLKGAALRGANLADASPGSGVDPASDTPGISVTTQGRTDVSRTVADRAGFVAICGHFVTSRTVRPRG